MIAVLGFMIVANGASAVLNIAVLDDDRNTVVGVVNLVIACLLAAALLVELT